jgi:hypothetical protein
MAGSYRRTFGPECIEELKGNIIQSHEEFLGEDDSAKKADFLRYMNCKGRRLCLGAKVLARGFNCPVIGN